MTRRTQRYALLAGGCAALVSLAALFMEAPAAPSAWLFAWFFWLGVPLGSLSVLCLHRLTGGHWGIPLRPVLTAATRTLPWLLLLAIPWLVSFDRLYHWLAPGNENPAPWYLNREFFYARLGLYFVVWSLLALSVPRHGARVAAGAAIMHGLVITFAAVDLVMSLQPGWYSTTFGLLVGTAQILSALAFCAVALHWLTPAPRQGERQDHHDLGNLLLAFVMIWAYLAFTQYLIIWYENLPREVAWYLPRRHNPWALLGIALVLFHFTLPFLLLLSRRNKRRLPRLAAIGLLLLLMRMGDSYWAIVPSVRAAPSWLDPIALIAVGGLWFGAFLFYFRGAAGAAHG